MRKFLTYTVIAVVVAGALLGARELQQAQQSATDEPVQVLDQTVVERGNLRVTVSATGAVAPQRQVPLQFESIGTVTEILVAEGAAVLAGDVLARLDTTQAEALLNEALLALEVQQRAYALLTSPPRPEDLAVAQAALNSAMAALNAAASTGVSAQDQQIAYIQSELARNQLWQAQLQRDIAANTTGPSIDVSGLLPNGGESVPQDIIDQANAALSGLIPSVNVDVSSFEAGLDQAAFGVAIADSNYNATRSRGGDTAGMSSAQAAATAAQIALDRLTNGAGERDLQLAEIGLRQAELTVESAQASLDRAKLVAPFDGVIARNNLVVGEIPPSQSAAMLLVDTSGYYVEIAADETDVVDLAVDQAVELDFDALPDELLTGQVARINLLPTTVGQLVTYPVRVALDPTDQPVRVGMTATATIIVNELRAVLIVPNRFIRLDRVTGKAYVTVQDAINSFREVEVVLGLRNEIASQIVSGVEDGTTLVLIPRGTFDPIRGFSPMFKLFKREAAPPPSTEPKAVIDVREIAKMYKMGDVEVHALRGVNLKIMEGEFVSIMGPSGSGKSTLMNILGALDQPTSGDYFLDGVNVSRLSESDLARVRNKKIGFVFQSFNLLKRTSALRQVELPLMYAGVSGRQKKAKAALESVGLGERLNHLPSELSGGQQQRVAIARSLVNEPAMILADEPTGNLDLRSGTEVMQIFQRLNRDQKITVVFVTHDPWIARHTNRVIMLRDGSIIADQQVKNPLVAGASERPSLADEMEEILQDAYYGGQQEEYN